MCVCICTFTAEAALGEGGNHVDRILVAQYSVCELQQGGHVGKVEMADADAHVRTHSHTHEMPHRQSQEEDESRGHNNSRVAVDFSSHLLPYSLRCLLRERVSNFQLIFVCHLAAILDCNGVSIESAKSPPLMLLLLLLQLLLQLLLLSITLSLAWIIT